MSTATRVVTYQLAYLTDRQITLCEKHAESPPYPLGPVSHGAGAGRCDVCSPDEYSPIVPVPYDEDEDIAEYEAAKRSGEAR